MGLVDRKRIAREHHGLGRQNRIVIGGNIVGWEDRNRIGGEHRGLGGQEENRRGTWVGWTGRE